MRAFAVAAGRKVAAAGAASASVTAAQPSAQARELLPQQVPEHRTASSHPVRKPLDEDWLLTDISDHEVLVFKPYSVEEVDAAVAQLAQQTFSGGVVIEDLSESGNETQSSTPSAAGSRASTDTTYGADADGVLEEPVHSAGRLRPGPDAGQLTDLLAVSRKLLSRPGLQREVFKCMLEDEEVRDLMLKQSRNLDMYLTAVGIHNPTLLPGPEGSTSGLLPSLTYGEDAAAGEGEGQGKDLMKAIMDAMVACIDKTGSALAGLGGWLRDRVNELASSLSALFGGPQPSASTEISKERAEKPRRTGDVVMGAVMVVSVAVLCVLLAGRPAFMARGLAGAAAAGAAANMQQQRRRV